MSLDLSTLNEQQIKAACCDKRAVLVTAGAGSGKTRMLTHRIAYLMEEKGVKPYNILAITFTNKAANEMKERLERMIPEASGLWVSTFHSMCVRILRRFIDRIGYTRNFSIYSEQEKENVLKRIVKELAEDRSSSLYGQDTKELDKLRKRASSIISDAKNEALSADDYFGINDYDDDAEALQTIFEQYEKALKKNNALDFDDLLVKTYVLLKSDSDALSYYRRKFEYIHVDEFQDTNVVQYMLIKILAGDTGNVFVVGDEDQCIYGWRGANIGNIVDFSKDFDCEIFKLERNYRSTKNILDLANSVICNNSQRLDKTLWTENSDGEQVTVFCARNETNEAEYVADVIKKLVDYGEYSYSDIAVLMRLNALSRTFEERFLAYNIPHKVYGGFKFFERKEIKDLLAYLRLCVNGSDTEALLRIINFPKRGIGAGAVGQLINYSDVMGQSLYATVMGIAENTDLPTALQKKVVPLKNVLAYLSESAEKSKPHELVELLVKLLDLNSVFGDDTEENINRKLNISYFAESIKQYEESNPEATLEDYLQMITLYSDLDGMDDGEDCVALATVHSVKGLEFKVVFVVGCEEGIMPLTRSMDSLNELEEERRLMYVAATRAMQKLYITWAASRFMYSERKYTVPSRFLKEAGFKVGNSQPLASQARERAAMYTRSAYDENIAAYGSRTGAPSYKTEQTAVKQKDAPSGFEIGTAVSHRKFGRGKILSLAKEAGGVYAEIEFEKFGKMMLSLQFAPLEIIDEK